jgi:ornithine cyclodeaminase/alanine dehydrogenase-like protein (mu-crystallin family)
MTKILTDKDVWSGLDMSRAIAAIRGALDARRDGTLVAPPRHAVNTGPGSLVFTVGGQAGFAGFRVYDTYPNSRQDQVTAVWRDGALQGLIVGSALGAVRTGAIGGVAVDALARPDASAVAIVGAGLQARTQLLAAAAVRDLSHVRVFSRTAQSRDAFAVEMQAKTGVRVSAASSVEEAFDGADIILSATTASAPVFRAEQVPAGCHITVAGPKFVGRHEWPAALADRAARIVTDAPDQLRAYPKPFLLAGTPHMDRIEDLARSTGSVERGDDDITLFVSTGLAGTEVFVADALLSTRR